MAQAQFRPQKTALLVAQRIVADIQAANGKAGDRLPPEKLMLEEYQVGRGTLRESLRFLELQGLISLKPGPGGGPVIEKPDGSGLATSLTLLLQFENAPYRTIAEARAGLEPMTAQLAAERFTDEQLAVLETNISEMKKNLGDEARFLELNEEFHDMIAHGSGNALFAHLIDALTGILDGSAIGITYPERRRTAVHAAHVRIYEAMVAHDGEKAAEAMRVHIDEYSRYAELKFPEVLASPISWGNG
jgi:GntR family transcriptional repressor for pyruvate dehydrogenase complex